MDINDVSPSIDKTLNIQRLMKFFLDLTLKDNLV